MKFRGRNAHPNRVEKPGWWGRRFRLPTTQARIKILAGESACPTFFHEVSRAERPSQQSRKTGLVGDPLVRVGRPRRPAGALHDADTVGPAAGRGRPARTGGSAPPNLAALGFSWNFAGGTPIPTESKNQSGEPVRETGDRRDCQRISGKKRRKSMAVSSVPGGHGARGEFFMKFRGPKAHPNRRQERARIRRVVRMNPAQGQIMASAHVARARNSW
jgi:hypothetical protein